MAMRPPSAHPGLRVLPDDMTYDDLLKMLTEQAIQGAKGEKGDPGIDVGAPGPWANLAFGAGWSDLAVATYGNSQQRLEGDIVRLRGVIESDHLPVAGETVFTLPPDRRPAKRRAVQVISTTNAAMYLFPDPVTGQVGLQWFISDPPGNQTILLDGAVIPL
jgi:hypothetical protein